MGKALGKTCPLQVLVRSFRGVRDIITLNCEIPPALLMFFVFSTLKQSSSSNRIILGNGEIRVVENGNWFSDSLRTRILSQICR